MEKLPAGIERIRPITNQLLRPPTLRDLAARHRREAKAELAKAFVLYSTGTLLVLTMTVLILKYAS